MMKAAKASAFLGSLFFLSIEAAPAPAPAVDETYPYTGPSVPVGDWIDPTINGNGKGFARIIEAPAVAPASLNPTNNINVISLSYLRDGVNVHYQTPFGLGIEPSITWGDSPSTLCNTTTGSTRSYVP